jgi:hypothetical protein
MKKWWSPRLHTRPNRAHRTEDAVSVVGLLITTEEMIAARPKREPAGGGGMPGGMGGLGYGLLRPAVVREGFGTLPGSSLLR